MQHGIENKFTAMHHVGRLLVIVFVIIFVRTLFFTGRQTFYCGILTFEQRVVNVDVQRGQRTRI